MSKENIKKINVEISEDCLINLKILSLKKRISLVEYVKDVLDKHVCSKSKILGINVEDSIQSG